MPSPKYSTPLSNVVPVASETLDVIEKNYKSAITNRSLHYLMNHTCFDLDDPLDFQIMEFLISQNKLKIKI